MKNYAPLHLAIVIGSLLAFSGCSREARRDRMLQSAAAHFEAGDYERARIEYQNVLQADPNNTAALKRLGLVWLERGAPMRALPYLLQVRTQDPNDRDVQLKTLQIALSSGKLDEARKGALALLARSAGNAEALLLLTETIRSADDREAARQALRSFPNRNVAAFHLASANLALHEGNLAVVKTNLERAIALEPKSPAAHAALAAFHLSQNAPAAAGESFETAAALSPVRSNERLRLFEFKSRHGRIEEAYAGLQAIVTQAPDFLPAWRGLAQLALREKKYDDASRHLQNVFDRDPGNYEARLVRAQLWLVQGKTQKAIEELHQLGAAFPGFAGPKYELAQAHLQNRDQTKAIAALQQAIIQNPDHEQAILLLAALQLRAGQPQPVVIALVDLLTKRPNLEHAQLLLVDALGALGRLDDIVRMARASIAAAPGNSRSHALLGLVLARQGKNAEARVSLEKSLELAPDLPAIVAELVQLDVADRDFSGARRRVQAQLAKHPTSAIMHLLDARIHAAQAHWNEAETALLRAVELNPGYTAAYDLLAHCFLAQKPAAAALARTDAFIATRPEDPGALWTAGNVYLQLRAFDKASRVYEQHLVANPDTISVLNNLAYIYSDHLSRPDRALVLARRARELEPNSPEVADTLGWILFQRQDYAAAFELLRESAAKRPNDSEIQSHFQRASQMMAAQVPGKD